MLKFDFAIFAKNQLCGVTFEFDLQKYIFKNMNTCMKWEITSQLNLSLATI